MTAVKEAFQCPCWIFVPYSALKIKIEVSKQHVRGAEYGDVPTFAAGRLVKQSGIGGCDQDERLWVSFC